MEANSSNNPETVPPTEHKLRWYQFSLRSLLIFVFLVAVLFSWVAVKREKARQRSLAFKRLSQLGVFEFAYTYPYSEEKNKEPFYLLGESEYSRIVGFHFDRDPELYSPNQDPQVTDNDLKILELFPEIEVVNLHNCRKITDEGLVYLRQLPQLRELNLSETNISDSGLEYIKQISGLQKLNLQHTSISESGINDLRRLLPNCIIESNSSSQQNKDHG